MHFLLNTSIFFFVNFLPCGRTDIKKEITNSTNTCPTTYPRTPTAVPFVTSSGCDTIYLDDDDDGWFYDYADPCIKSYCYASLRSYSNYYESAGITSYAFFTRTYNSGILGTGTLADVATAESYYTVTESSR